VRKTLWRYEGLLETQRREWQARRSDVLFLKADSILESADPELWTTVVERFGEDRVRDAERRWTLHLMDELWSDYLAAVADVRGGIHWVSWGGKDPLHTFLMEVTGMFERLDEELREELVAAFAREEFKPEGELPSSFERSATWTYVINDHPWGTMQERWAAKVAQALRVRLAATAPEPR